MGCVWLLQEVDVGRKGSLQEIGMGGMGYRRYMWEVRVCRR